MKYAPLAITLALIALVPGVIFAENAGITGDGTGLQSVPDIEPSSTDVGPVAHTGAEYKFDDSFYQKIQNLMDEIPQEGDPGVYDGTRYYNVILVVSRDDGDDRDPDEVAKENKEAVVKRLNLLGARDIVAAEMLSFVTASIPVANVPGFSLHDEVYKLGDGELPVTPEIDTARQTIRATANEIRAAAGTNLNGAGVTVAVIDTGINHTTAFGNRVIEQIYCDASVNLADPADTVCVTPSVPIFFRHMGVDYPDRTSHGTQVAQILAASGLALNNGIAPDVRLLDVQDSGYYTNLAHTLDWSLKHGADVVNMSFGIGQCSTRAHTTFDLIVNEAVDKGMILVKSAGNENGITRINYESITNPGCGHNIITVGGINDRDSDSHVMYVPASRGPTDNDNRLKPDIAAPAHELVTLRNIADTATQLSSGTSFAAPQVSASAALLLQAKPDLTPLQVRAALLLGATWQGPAQCTSAQYEVNAPDNNCSYARQPNDATIANNAASLGILNNVGLGILDTAASLRYATSDSTHIASDHLTSDTDIKQFQFTITDTTQPVKIILTWLAHPHGGIDDQTSRSAVNVANLDFTTTLNGAKLSTASGESDVQNNEFAVFTPPQAGDYVITVNGSRIDMLNKPVQNFALASTVPLTSIPTTTNHPPVAESQTFIVGPNIDSFIRLVASDPDNDAISFHVSKDPGSGIVTTDEFIDKKVSRVLYTPSASFTGDSFEVTPSDGITTGTAATITLVPESLPTGWKDGKYDESKIRDWDTLHITSGFSHTKQSKIFTGKSYSVSQINVGSDNMEAVHAEIRTNAGTYKVAIPSSGSRTIDFVSPITITSVKILAGGIDEETVYEKNKGDSKDVKAYVGYKPAPCPDSSVSGGSGSSSCPVMPTLSTYTTSLSTDTAIPDGTRTQSVTSTIKIPRTGVLSDIKVLVNIEHTWKGDLKVILTSPAGTPITLHDRDGGSTNNIIKTYTVSHPDLKSLVGSQISGNWILSVGDYAGADIGALKSWGLILKYTPTVTTPMTPSTPSTPTTSTLFSDDFESGLGKWTETGDGDWTISTSPQHRVPTAPGHSSSNKVLHVDDSDNPSIITLKNSIDLTSYASASLSFKRFVDSALDSGEYLKVELYSGRVWVPVYYWVAGTGATDGRWHSESYDLKNYLDKTNFKIRFVAKMSIAVEDVQIDDVLIKGTTGTSTPTPVPTPTPTPTPTPAPTPTGGCTHPTTPYSIYVADTDDNEIRVYSPTGTYLGQMISGSSSINKPWDVAFGPDGNMYVAEYGADKISKYNGATGAVIDSNWVATGASPASLVWNNNVLYVGTTSGLERYSASGTSLGDFGDAKARPADRATPMLVTAYDIVFADNRMYISDKAYGRIAYYNPTTGSHLGLISGSSSSPPDTYRAHGLECGPQISGGGSVLYQSGQYLGVNKINTATKALIETFTTNMRGPYGIDADSSGNLFVANSRNHNILKVAPSGTVSILISNDALDDPRGVTVGPVYTRVSGQSFEPEDPPNDAPVFTVLYNGTAVYAPVPLESSPATFTVKATDSENDAITIEALAGDLPESAVSTVDSQDGTATITVNPEDVSSGTYVFWIVISDPDNYAREPYMVIIP